MEERLMDLEIRITHLEDMIDELNKLVYQQQLLLDRGEKLMKEMAERLADFEGQLPLNEKPPHY